MRALGHPCVRPAFTYASMQARALALFALLAACGGKIESGDSGSSGASEEEVPEEKECTLPEKPDSGDSGSGAPEPQKSDCESQVEWVGECQVTRVWCGEGIMKMEIHCLPGPPEGPPGHPDPGPR